MMDFSESVILAEGIGIMTVRRIILRGSNRMIGKKLAEVAISRHGFDQRTAAATAPSVNRQIRCYLAENCPILAERSRGVADALGLEPEDDRFDSTGISYNQYSTIAPGCSSVYYPPTITGETHGILSRNFDFPLTTLPEMMGMELLEEERKLLKPMMADPYIVEMYPEDGGYASVALVSFDLLSGVLDGINSEGLVVAVHGNEITRDQSAPQPEGIGLHELQSMRLLLDTCATAEEAKTVLFANRHFYVMLPCIYLVADCKGNSLVFEPGHDGGEHRITEFKGKPCILTNHPLSMYPSLDSFPPKRSFLEAGTSSFERFEKLSGLHEKKVGYTLDDMKRINGEVAVSNIVSRIPARDRAKLVQSRGLARTLWHAIYDTQACSLDIKFFTGDDKTDDGGFKENYTNYIRLELE